MEPTGLNTLTSTYSIEFALFKHMYENLVTLDDDDNTAPGAAESWDYDEDTLTYTFHLRKDGVWTNGDPVTAKDFEFAWSQALNPDVASDYAYFLYFIKNAEKYFNGEVTWDEVGVKVVDDYTLEVTLEQPTPYALFLFSFGTLAPINQRFYEAVGADLYSTEAQYFCTNGPFALTEWSHNDKIVMQKNDAWHGAADVEVKAEEAAPAEDTTAEAEAPAQTTEDNGTVSTDGSTSMEKVIGALGESFMAQNDGVTFTYNPTGSGSGITAVEEGRCDIGLSSRNLKDEEVAKGLTQTVLAYDGIAIIVNPENPVADLDIDTIARIYKGEIKNWSEVGGNDAEIVLIGREAGSGTRDGFESITETEDACAYRQELTSTGDVITTVAQNPDAIGYASLASVKDSVKALSVGGVVPTEDTVKDGSYVIQRPFVLVTKDGVALSATARKFFDYITSADAAGIISEAGAVAAN